MQTTFPILDMSVSPAHRLRNRASAAPWRNVVWPSYTKQTAYTYHGGRVRPVYYVEDRAGLRYVGFADEIVRLRHNGWFTDREFQDDVMRGVVYMLPHGRYVAGYHFNGGDDKGATLWFDELHDTKEDAARMADEHARVAAEAECDYQDEERAKLQAEEDEEALRY